MYTEQCTVYILQFPGYDLLGNINVNDPTSGVRRIVQCTVYLAVI